MESGETWNRLACRVLRFPGELHAKSEVGKFGWRRRGAGAGEAVLKLAKPEAGPLVDFNGVVKVAGAPIEFVGLAGTVGQLIRALPVQGAVENLFAHQSFQEAELGLRRASGRGDQRGVRGCFLALHGNWLWDFVGVGKLRELLPFVKIDSFVWQTKMEAFFQSAR